jgi:hypothetical protein
MFNCSVMINCIIESEVEPVTLLVYSISQALNQALQNSLSTRVGLGTMNGRKINATACNRTVIPFSLANRLITTVTEFSRLLIHIRCNINRF